MRCNEVEITKRINSWKDNLLIHVSACNGIYSLCSIIYFGQLLPATEPKVPRPPEVVVQAMICG